MEWFCYQKNNIQLIDKLVYLNKGAFTLVFYTGIDHFDVGQISIALYHPRQLYFYTLIIVLYKIVAATSKIEKSTKNDKVNKFIEHLK